MAYIITRDGASTGWGRFATEDDAAGELLRRQGQSVEWATTYEGYGILEVVNLPDPTRTTHYVGRTADGTRVYAEASISYTDKRMHTVEHARADAGAPVFTASGFAIGYRRRTAYCCGQMLDMLADVTTPAPGWTPEDVSSLLAVWRRWHLNSAKAACAHMPADAHARWDRGEDVRCPQTGYRYGSGWLLDLLPLDVLAEVRRLQQLPTGYVPTDY